MTIIDLLESYKIPYVGEEHHHGTHGWVQIDCPNCGKNSRKYHLGIHLGTGKSSCWQCGRKYTATVLSTITGESSYCIIEKLKQLNLRPPKREKHTGTLQIPSWIQPILDSPAHISYLKNRGFDTARLAKLWGIQAIRQDAHLAWRIFIPIHLNGEIVSWTTRAIGSKCLRYKSARTDQEAVPHKSILYGMDYARNTIIVTEGPTDVWRLGPGAVATFGLSYTTTQLLAMAKYPRRIVCFDSDSSARKRSRELANALSLIPGETYEIEIESASDVASADSNEVEMIRKKFL